MNEIPFNVRMRFTIKPHSGKLDTITNTTIIIKIIITIIMIMIMIMLLLLLILILPNNTNATMILRCSL